MMLPAFDRDNNPIRDAHGQLIVTEKIVMPNPQALMFIIATASTRSPASRNSLAYPRSRSGRKKCK